MKDITVAVIQSIAVPGDLPRAVSDHARLSIQAAHRGARLAVFPELSLTGYSLALTREDALTTDDPRLQMLQQVADAHGIVIVAGAPIESPKGLHIGALCFAPREMGTFLIFRDARASGPVGRENEECPHFPQTYSKRFLHEGEDKTFAPGVGGDPLSIHDHVVSLAICAEITHPEHATEAARRGANIYAASCFITPNGYACDTDLLVGYAREHGMMVLMANFGNGNGLLESAGRSAIWSHTGELLIQAPAEGEAVLVATMHSAPGDDEREYSSPACYLHEFEPAGGK